MQLTWAAAVAVSALISAASIAASHHNPSPQPSKPCSSHTNTHTHAPLTHQAGVGQQTCSMIPLLAAAGTALSWLAVELELGPARPAGAKTGCFDN